MIKFITRVVFTLFAILFSASTVLAQTSNLFVIDSFGDHSLPGWYSGGSISMKYSHKEDNLENGYGIISSGNTVITPNSFIGLVRKDSKMHIPFVRSLVLFIRPIIHPTYMCVILEIVIRPLHTSSFPFTHH